VNRKIDYHDDPAAPEPNSLVPAVTVVVAREDGAILLIRRTDNTRPTVAGLSRTDSRLKRPYACPCEPEL
jgi:hypothetical protein